MKSPGKRHLVVGMRPEEIKAFVLELAAFVREDRKPARFAIVKRICMFCQREFDYEEKEMWVRCLECRLEGIVRKHLCSANDFAQWRRLNKRSPNPKGTR